MSFTDVTVFNDDVAAANLYGDISAGSSNEHEQQPRNGKRNAPHDANLDQQRYAKLSKISHKITLGELEPDDALDGGLINTRWQRNAALVREYVAEFGRLPPQGKGGVYRDVNLGPWINTQRMAKKGIKGGSKMTPDREQDLESIPGWFWEQDIDAAWQQNADLLREYVAEFGRLPPCTGKGGIYCDVNLGNWIGSQRTAKKGIGTCKITPERERVLESIPGWFWKLDLDAAWQQNADLLREYVAEFGRIPPTGSKGGVYRDVNLGIWISNQRKAKKGIKGAGKMTPERERELESIPGWYWKQDVACQCDAGLARAHVAEFGQLPPQGKGVVYRDVNLGKWMSV